MQKRTLSWLLISIVLPIDGLRVPDHATALSKYDDIQPKYDFIIAGAGIAGLTLADRLTEDKNSTSLLLAGVDNIGVLTGF